jgi:predicted nucleic acid-binding protein
MRYIDTSVLLAYLIPEAGSAVAEALMLSSGEPLATDPHREKFLARYRKQRR